MVAEQYEKDNGLQINNFFVNKPTPEDWVNTILVPYRTESIDALETASVDKVRSCPDYYK